MPRLNNKVEYEKYYYNSYHNDGSDTQTEWGVIIAKR